MQNTMWIRWYEPKCIQINMGFMGDVIFPWIFKRTQGKIPHLYGSSTVLLHQGRRTRVAIAFIMFVVREDIQGVLSFKSGIGTMSPLWWHSLQISIVCCRVIELSTSQNSSYIVEGVGNPFTIVIHDKIVVSQICDAITIYFMLLNGNALYAPQFRGTCARVEVATYGCNQPMKYGLNTQSKSIL